MSWETDPPYDDSIFFYDYSGEQLQPNGNLTYTGPKPLYWTVLVVTGILQPVRATVLLDGVVEQNGVPPPSLVMASVAMLL